MFSPKLLLGHLREHASLGGKPSRGLDYRVFAVAIPVKAAVATAQVCAIGVDARRVAAANRGLRKVAGGLVNDVSDGTLVYVVFAVHPIPSKRAMASVGINTVQTESAVHAREAGWGCWDGCWFLRGG